MEFVVLVGLQGAGKTTFYRERFAVTHAHVSKDNFRNNPRPARRQRHLIAEAFADGRSVVVDNTNPTAADRLELVELARAAGAEPICYYFPPETDVSLRRNALREGRARVPSHAVRITAARLEPLAPTEGFDRLFVVRLIEGYGFEVTEVTDGRNAADRMRGVWPPARRCRPSGHIVRNRPDRTAIVRAEEQARLPWCELCDSVVGIDPPGRRRRTILRLSGSSPMARGALVPCVLAPVRCGRVARRFGRAEPAVDVRHRGHQSVRFGRLHQEVIEPCRGRLIRNAVAGPPGHGHQP